MKKKQVLEQIESTHAVLDMCSILKYISICEEKKFQKYFFAINEFLHDFDFNKYCKDLLVDDCNYNCKTIVIFGSFKKFSSNLNKIIYDNLHKWLNQFDKVLFLSYQPMKLDITLNNFKYYQIKKINKITKSEIIKQICDFNIFNHFDVNNVIYVCVDTSYHIRMNHINIEYSSLLDNILGEMFFYKFLYFSLISESRIRLGLLESSIESSNDLLLKSKRQLNTIKKMKSCKDILTSLICSV